MKQVVIRNGRPTLVEMPAPSPEMGRVLIATAASVISSGTERSAASGPLAKRAARSPEMVRTVVDHAREHGVRDAVDRVRGALEADQPTGYSAAGHVLDTGGVPGISTGQLVAAAGAGYANHAERILVPERLVAAVPAGLDPHRAAFGTLGAIALQAVRRAEVTVGDRVAVVGLGLLGQLAAQIATSAGCDVLGIEPDANRRAVAESVGIPRVTDPANGPALAHSWTAGVGVDAVLVTASGKDPGLVNDAVALLRRKGRIVPVGDVTLSLERGPLYEREADVLISTSYGPGRYDSSYEESGLDYPIAYVRWTEQRNLQEVLRLIATDRLRVDSLIGLETTIDRAADAFEALLRPSPPIAAMLTYPDSNQATATSVRPARRRARRRSDGTRIAIIGPGSFVKSVHVPNLRRTPDAHIVALAGRTPTAASALARSIPDCELTTDWRTVIERDDIDLVLIGTRHDSHAEIAIAALRAGKSVFVEKPLGLTREEIDAVQAAESASAGGLMVGFNRPFAPLARRMRHEVCQVDGPLSLSYRVSAPMASDHWLNDPVVGGGRLVGEACHMFDFACWIAGPAVEVFAAAPPAGEASPSSASITLRHLGGAVSTILYVSSGGPAMPKERIEVFRGGTAWVLDDFRRLVRFGTTERTLDDASRADKGHAALMRAMLEACAGSRPFVPGVDEGHRAQVISFAALSAIETGEPQPAE